MVNTVRVYADHRRDFADHMINLKHFTKGFSAFRFSLHLMLKQALSNLIVCLMISPKNYMQKLHRQASMLQWILGRFGFSQN